MGVLKKKKCVEEVGPLPLGLLWWWWWWEKSQRLREKNADQNRLALEEMRRVDAVRKLILVVLIRNGLDKSFEYLEQIQNFLGGRKFLSVFSVLLNKTECLDEGWWL